MQGHDIQLPQFLTILPTTSMPASPKTSKKRRALAKPSTASAQDKRPRSTRALSQAETRERLLDAARAVLAAEGYAGASIDRIAAAAGYTKGAFYANFPTKEAVFIELFEQHKQREQAAFRAFLARDGDVASVLDAIGHDLQSARANADWPRLSVEIRRQAERSTALAAQIDALQVAQRTALAEVVAALFAKAGRELPATADALANLFVAVAHGLAMMRPTTSPRTPTPNANEGAMLMLVMRSVIAAAPPAR
ncbi:TetR/AcrR family transcriptional regulator [Gemmatimonas groenlandica]|uniref:TetR/AcrR family transcriptional regulator n=2 Tax=Gemmatimonas groenlandica TaxID=2732249 RepID=A0A6M4IHH8_9BACT|nr:TetR/AcrR family transcriptional regulator [Gemmatimonas groenlandica]